MVGAKGVRMEMELKAIQISTLQLGDHVNFGCDPFGWGTVTAVWDDAIEITRPYLHTSDFSSVASRSGETTGSRLIAYTGLETFRIFRSETRPMLVAYRTTVPA